MAVPRRLTSLSPVPKAALGLALVLTTACSPTALQTESETPLVQPATTVYAVRHAEKGDGDDPGLTSEGERRAAALAELLGGEDIAAVFATEYRRTQQTVAPLAQAVGQDVIQTPARDPEGLAFRIQADFSGRSVVAAGHSNTVPTLITGLGVEESVTLAETDYGDLFVVVVQPDGTAELSRRRFGD